MCDKGLKINGGGSMHGWNPYDQEKELDLC